MVATKACNHGSEAQEGTAVPCHAVGASYCNSDSLRPARRSMCISVRWSSSCMLPCGGAFAIWRFAACCARRKPGNFVGKALHHVANFKVIMNIFRSCQRFFTITAPMTQMTALRYARLITQSSSPKRDYFITHDRVVTVNDHRYLIHFSDDVCYSLEIDVMPNSEPRTNRSP